MFPNSLAMTIHGDVSGARQGWRWGAVTHLAFPHSKTTKGELPPACGQLPSVATSITGPATAGVRRWRPRTYNEPLGVAARTVSPPSQSLTKPSLALQPPVAQNEISGNLTKCLALSRAGALQRRFLRRDSPSCNGLLGRRSPRCVGCMRKQTKLSRTRRGGRAPFGIPALYDRQRGQPFTGSKHSL